MTSTAESSNFIENNNNNNNNNNNRQSSPSAVSFHRVLPVPSPSPTTSPVIPTIIPHPTEAPIIIYDIQHQNNDTNENNTNDTNEIIHQRDIIIIPISNENDQGNNNSVQQQQTNHSIQKLTIARLPDGRIIDSKNTLQSFDDVYENDLNDTNHDTSIASPLYGHGTTTTTHSKLSSSSSLLFLHHHHHHHHHRWYRNPSNMEEDGLVCPTMEEISALTDPLLLLSSLENSHTVVAMHVVGVDDDDDINDDRGRTVELHADAVAVVDAEIMPTESAPEVLLSLLLLHHAPSSSSLSLLGLQNPMRATRFIWRTMAVVMFVVVVVVMIIGVTFSRTTVSDSGSTNAIDTSTTNHNNESDVSLTIICQFLNMPNVSECQQMTAFAGKALGIVIPSEIGLLTQLTLLDLNDNRLMGSIPSSLGQLTRLAGLDLSRNQLTGTIPSSFGNLIHLVTLEMSDNQLTGLIPTALGNLNQLLSLDCFQNSLQGTIPSTMFRNLTQITAFLVDDNQLSGSIPSTLGYMSQLTFLSLRANHFTGTIPTILGNLRRLGDLDLSSNRLTSSIPSTLGKLYKLYSLDLNSNQLTGKIPSVLGRLPKLTDLNLYENPKLSGTIPSSLCSTSEDTSIRIDCDNENIVCSCCRDAWVGPVCA